MPLGLGGLKMTIAFEKVEERPLEFANLELDGLTVPEPEWSVPNRIPSRQACLFTGHGAAADPASGLYPVEVRIQPQGKRFAPGLFAGGDGNVAPVFHATLGALAAQLFLTSRLLKRGGLAAIIFALPMLALLASAVVALAPRFAWAKISGAYTYFIVGM